MTTDLDPLVQALEELEGGSLVVLTGAGISLASGIPTFRGSDPGAVWKRDVVDMATASFFARDPVESWRWYLDRFQLVSSALPNPAHHALVALERWQTGRGRFLLITQNVDTLHDRAGSRQLVEVHGRSDRLRCPADGCRYGAPRGSLPRADFDLGPFLADPRREHLPRCPACGAILRQHVLWFDEVYADHDDFQWDRVREAAETMDCLLSVGTSFSVGVTELFLQSALFRGVPVFSLDPAAGPPPYPGVVVLREKAEEVLPRLVAALETGRTG